MQMQAYTVSNKYNTGARNMLESIIYYYHPYLQQATQQFGYNQPPATGYFSYPQMQTYGYGQNYFFGANNPTTFGFQGNNAFNQQTQPQVEIQTEYYLYVVQESLNQAQNIRASILKLRLNENQRDVITREYYMSDGYAESNYYQKSIRPSEYLLYHYNILYQSAVYSTSATQRQQEYQNYTTIACDTPAHFYNTVIYQNFFKGIGSSGYDPSRPPHVANMNPNAPKLLNYQYFTTPRLSTLYYMSNYELYCVYNFKISKIVDNYLIGSILFKSGVNLMNVDLDQIVYIDKGMCNVIMCTKEASQLNVPAIISLYNVFCGEGGSQQAFYEKIKATTQQAGGRLIKYDAGSGEWVFEVSGFV